MVSLKDGAESVKDEMVKRMQSPFVGAFVIAWCVVNYEFLIVLFSEGNYADKIGYIARRFFYGSDILHSFGKPLLIAAGSTMVLPLVNLTTNLWNKAVDILGTQMSLWMETKRRVSDPELRERVRTRTYQLELMRRCARGLVVQNSVTSARLFTVGHFGREDARALRGLRDKSINLTDETKFIFSTAGFPLQGYRILKLLRDNIAIEEGPLIRDTKDKPDEDYARIVLSTLLGLNFVLLIWEGGPEPSYEISSKGKALLDLIEEDYPEVFTPRFEPSS